MKNNRFILFSLRSSYICVQEKKTIAIFRHDFRRVPRIPVTVGALTVGEWKILSIAVVEKHRDDIIIRETQIET